MVALDERIRRQRLTTAERHGLIRQLFVFLSGKVERRFAATHIDAGVGLAVVAAIALLVLALSVGKTGEEIELFLGELGKAKHKIGRKLRVAQILESLQAAPL